MARTAAAWVAHEPDNPEAWLLEGWARERHGQYVEAADDYRRLLQAQTWIRQNGPEYIRDMELISMPELHEIRRIWVFEKHELEDSVPRIYEECTGEHFPGRPLEEHVVLGSDDVDLLRELCGDDELHFEMTRSLIAVIAGVVTLVVGGTAIAVAAGGGGPTPPPKPLDQAIHDAVSGSAVDGVQQTNLFRPSRHHRDQLWDRPSRRMADRTCDTSCS